MLTHDLNKERGMVFGYKSDSNHLRSINLGGRYPDPAQDEEHGECFGLPLSCLLPADSSTCFSIGTSSKGLGIGTLGSQSKP